MATGLTSSGRFPCNAPSAVDVEVGWRGDLGINLMDFAMLFLSIACSVVYPTAENV